MQLMAKEINAVQKASASEARMSDTNRSDNARTQVLIAIARIAEMQSSTIYPLSFPAQSSTDLIHTNITPMTQKNGIAVEFRQMQPSHYRTPRRRSRAI
jgi:hypothetical protein